MSEQDLSVGIEADASKLKTGLEDATNAIKSATTQMSDATKTMSESSKSSLSAFLSALKSFGNEASETTKHAAEEVAAHGAQMGSGLQVGVAGLRASVASFGGIFATLAEHIGAVGAVVAGGAIFKEAISATNNWNMGALKLAKQLGITTQEAAALMVATHGLGIDQNILGEAVQKVAKQLMKGGEGFKTMGIEVKDAATGGFRPAMQIIEETNEKIKAINNPILQNQAGMSAYGLAWAEVKPLMKLTSEQMDEAREKVEALGLSVSSKNVADTKEFQMAWREVGLATEAISINLGQALLPAFKDILVAFAAAAQFLVSTLKPAFELLSFAVTNITEVISEFSAIIKSTFTNALETIGSLVKNVFGADIKNSVDVARAALNIFMAGIIGVKTIVIEAMLAIKLAFAEMAEAVKYIAKMVVDEVSLNWKKLAADTKESDAAMVSNWDKAMKEMSAQAEKSADQINKLFNKPKEKPPEKEVPEPAPKYDFTRQKDTGDKSRMAEFEEQLARKKVLYQEDANAEDSYREYSKELEIEFWQQRLALVDKSGHDGIAIRTKIAEQELALSKQDFEAEIEQLKTKEVAYHNNVNARLEIEQEIAVRMKAAYGNDSKEYAEAQKAIVESKRQAATQIKAIADEDAKMVELRASHEIDVAQTASSEREKLGIQNAQKTLQLEAQFEEQRYQLKLKELQKELELAKLSPDANPVEIAKLNAQIEQLAMKHADTMVSISAKEVEAQKAQYQSFFSAFENGLQKSIVGLVQGTMTMRQAWNNLVRDMISAMVQFVAQTIAKAASAAIAQMLWGKTAAASNITANAATGASAAIASTAAIPIVGPPAAPAAGAGIFAQIMSYMGFLPSAAGGFDIPAGTNPLTQLHEREMVLPAKHADVIRGLADNGVGGGGDMHLHVHALDGASVKKLFANNGQMLTDVMRSQRRNFAKGV